MFGAFSIYTNVFEKPSKIVEDIPKFAGSKYTYLLFQGPEDEPLYMLKPRAIDVLVWVNNKILFALNKENHVTIDVRIRIATSMLNKLVDNGDIPKCMAIAYHTRLVSNTRKILSEILVEDLPF